MAYSDFTVESVQKAFGVKTLFADLFPGLVSLPVPSWVFDTLDRGRKATPMLSEKARSESLVLPILHACRELAPENLSIYSGQRLDVDPSLGLTGECDYILALTPLAASLRAPVVTILEAKKGDIEAGLGQCIAQTIAARTFNEREGEPDRPMFGCVTTGDVWRFFRLDGANVIIDQTQRFIIDIGGILAALRECLIAGSLDSATRAD